MNVYTEFSNDKVNEVSELDAREKRVLDKIVKTIEEYLDKTHPGLLTRLDWFFYYKYRESFIKRLLSNPEETIIELLDYYGVDSFDKADTLKYVIYVVLKNFFVNNPIYFEEAFNYIKQQNWIKFKKLLKKYIDSLT